MQIVIAGKAHPADDGGKRLIQQMVQFADAPAVRRRIVFLPDYDMAMADGLVQGCDVWLNNPLRPLEACGTSGMKAALNGGLNLSVRDGWWDEWYDGGNGWEIPSADGVADTGRRDELEASALYELLGKSVAPLFYDPDADGVPQGWLEMVRHTLRSARPPGAGGPDGRRVRDRAVRAGRAGLARAADGDGFGPARELAAWKQRVVRRPGRGCGSSTSRPTAAEQLARRGADRAGHGRARRADAGRCARRGGLRPDRRGRRDRRAVLRHAGARARGRTAPPPGCGTPVELPLDRPGPFGYTVRVLPRHPLLDSRAELGLVTYPEAPAGMTNGDLR